ncbi:PASTA domain-containing protein [Bacillus sp. AFS031507]|uniref:PASTA domain-containing protein n=1 Tax=Bacillus sp. AFS031507 TaxID=2033496 RepID=UPI000BFD111C|nr:PASTA domain-containing protein [Bacillus sp. AFS031507]PGY11064.1 hypothetical protein COE25_15030 [Bacillus sp. AFS031507]
MQKFIPYRPGMELGRGFNTLTGEARGNVVTGDINPSENQGQKVISTATIVNSQEKMLDTLNVSIEASMHYGAFSGEASFGFSQQSTVTSQSTYVVAQCRVENPYTTFADPKLKDEAAKIMTNDGPEVFNNSYGNSFIRGTCTGGELYVLFQLTSSSTEEQEKTAVSLQIAVEGLLAGGELNAAVTSVHESMKTLSSQQITFYQRAGSGITAAPVTDVPEILDRLKKFPQFVKEAPYPFQVEIVDYEVLTLPPFDKLAIQLREEALTECAKVKLKYQSILAELEVVGQNKQLFEDTCKKTTQLTGTVENYKFNDADLINANAQYTNALNYLNRHAHKIMNKEIEPDLFVLSNYDKNLSEELLSFVFIKKAPKEERVQVPNVMNLNKKTAEEVLKAQGLNPILRPFFTKDQPFDVIKNQVPSAGEEVPKGTSVVIDYSSILLIIKKIEPIH